VTSLSTYRFGETGEQSGGGTNEFVTANYHFLRVRGDAMKGGKVGKKV
jgi:hypothetical protein